MRSIPLSNVVKMYILLAGKHLFGCFFFRSSKLQFEMVTFLSVVYMESSMGIESGALVHFSIYQNDHYKT